MRKMTGATSSCPFSSGVERVKTPATVAIRLATDTFQSQENGSCPGGPAFRFSDTALKIEDNLGNCPLVVDTSNENITLSMLEALRHTKIQAAQRFKLSFMQYKKVSSVVSPEPLRDVTIKYAQCLDSRKPCERKSLLITRKTASWQLQPLCVFEQPSPT